MPRFLNTMSGEFEWHDDPKDITYAILSHTWRSTEHGGEQSYQDIQTLQATLSDKIRGVCKIARKAGFRLVWIDSCCIDKYNGAELPPAITSMYEWYMLSTICYVYLDDVHDSCDPDALRRAFCLSRWHSRGWTLQELVAPEHVVFMTRAWSVLGTKLGLASILAEVTGVNFDILTGAATVHSVSVAQRMSWAARRTTTQVEDAAYSLMGIFDVHIPPIYGEGTNAFLRLQEEIMRTIPDQSIFAW
ncbi:HET-domain-containing protein, partial [Trametes versicolor FP-101664 SS1]|uniref:HET-domain-containing protein n=1 Tax=Trametes versicolor (strain FP-101664) TaxID=717944 RepID=UPI0004624549